MIKQTTIGILGYDEKLETGEYTEGVVFEVLAENEEQAVAVAKALYEKPNYLLRAYVEQYVKEDAPHYTVFFVSCYEHYDKQTKTYYQHVGVQVMASSADEALQKAKEIAKKSYYKITDILQKWQTLTFTTNQRS